MVFQYLSQESSYAYLILSSYQFNLNIFLGGGGGGGGKCLSYLSTLPLLEG